MVFCNEKIDKSKNIEELSHNPYFNRWFSAIRKYKTEDKIEALSQSLF